MENTSTQTKELLAFVHKNARMGTVTLERLAEKLAAADRGMADEIAAQLCEYRRITDAAERKAKQRGESGDNAGTLAEAAAAAMVELKSIADKSPSHIAEMVIVGSTRGIVSAIRQLRMHPDADSDAVNLACRLLCAEQTNVERMKRFL